ncbi:hypothetical protein [Cupriavidus sp. Marseille-Q8015]
MSTIIVRDLALSRDLDRSSLATIRGGTSWLGRVGSAGPLANVNININQNIAQLQEINVATLNGSVIGKGLGHVNVDVNPSQWGGNWAAV